MCVCVHLIVNLVLIGLAMAMTHDTVSLWLPTLGSRVLPVAAVSRFLHPVARRFRIAVARRFQMSIVTSVEESSVDAVDSSSKYRTDTPERNFSLGGGGGGGVGGKFSGKRLACVSEASQDDDGTPARTPLPPFKNIKLEKIKFEPSEPSDLDDL